MWVFGLLYFIKIIFCIKLGIINIFDIYRFDLYNWINLYRYVWCYIGWIIKGFFIIYLGKCLLSVRSLV